MTYGVRPGERGGGAGVCAHPHVLGRPCCGSRSATPLSPRAVPLCPQWPARLAFVRIGLCARGCAPGRSGPLLRHSLACAHCRSSLRLAPPRTAGARERARPDAGDARAGGAACTRPGTASAADHRPGLHLAVDGSAKRPVRRPKGLPAMAPRGAAPGRLRNSTRAVCAVASRRRIWPAVVAWPCTQLACCAGDEFCSRLARHHAIIRQRAAAREFAARRVR